MPSKAGVSRSGIIPAPVGGWDTREALADMPAENAVIMDNWFPETDKVTLRRGYTSHATGMSGAVETILEYTTTAGENEIYAANGANIFNVSSSGAVGAAVATGFNSAQWQQVQMGTAGGEFLLCVNGQDTPQLYNGSTWANATFTGPTVANLRWCNLHQRRLWFGEKESLSAWYLDVNAITGAATEFPLYGIARLGGYIMGMGTWTRDGGDGADDVAVFLTSEGEAIIYQGIDPSAASTWALIGRFVVGRPVGRRCLQKFGGDLLMLTEDGIIPASSLLSMDRSQAQKGAITKQIASAVNDAVRLYSGVFGWQMIIYPKARMLITNIPKSTTTSDQYVFNTITGAPARFTSINAISWGKKGDDIYFGGSDGVVYKFDDGTTDNGSAIVGDLLPAYNYFRSPSATKTFHLVNPIFEADGDPSVQLALCTDFKLREATAAATPMASGSALWGSAIWGSGLWGSSPEIFKGWRGVIGNGRAASLRMKCTTSSVRPSLVVTHFTFSTGGQL